MVILSINYENTLLILLAFFVFFVWKENRTEGNFIWDSLSIKQALAFDFFPLVCTASFKLEIYWAWVTLMQHLVGLLRLSPSLTPNRLKGIELSVKYSLFTYFHGGDIVHYNLHSYLNFIILYNFIVNKNKSTTSIYYSLFIWCLVTGITVPGWKPRLLHFLRYSSAQYVWILRCLKAREDL